MLCMCTPAGQEEFFMAVGVPVTDRAAKPPTLNKEEQAAKGKLARSCRRDTAPNFSSRFARYRPAGGRI
jgi:hypothetical protein